MIEIQNDFLKITVSEDGGELRSIIDYNNNHYLWEGDPKHWAYCSPILFPVISQLCNDTYLVNGEEYHLPKHGFTRLSKFQLVEQNNHEVTLSLQANEETLKGYPFQFEMRLKYTLDQNKVITTCTIKNNDTQVLPFQLGFHPGFYYPFQNSNQAPCNITFEHPEKVMGKENVTQLSLEEENLFYPRNTITIVNPISNTVSFHNETQSIQLDISGSTRLAIWRKEPDTPFICIEPQHGGGDSKDAITDIYERMGTTLVEPNDTFETSYSIQINS